MTTACCLALVVLLAPAAFAPDASRAGAPLDPDRVTELEREAGWRPLFDGATSSGWVGNGTDAFPAGWEIEGGCLHLLPGSGGGDLVTREAFGDFELELEWKLAAGANSGVKYRIEEAGEPAAMLGPEFQLLDDAAFPDERPEHLAGALYDLAAPQDAPASDALVFHRARIVARGASIEHWLDGRRVVSCTIGDDEWKRRVAASKFAGVESFASPRSARIGLQDHGGEVWFRNLRIRTWPPAGELVELYDGKSLAGWRAVGDAHYEATEDGILGEVEGGSQSFLVTEREYGDFVLELELRAEGPGNSGIQVRSHQRDDGRVFGYQIEIDPSDRAWSGGLYDEARRGWLDDLSDDAEARAAFSKDGWNRYRIECIGPWIRSSVNGVPAADRFDCEDLAGFIGLQVHAGKDTRVRWRDLRLVDLGRRRWLPVAGDVPRTLGLAIEHMLAFTVVPDLPADFAFRVRYREEGAQLHVVFRGDEDGALDAATLVWSGERAGPGLRVGPDACRFDSDDEELGDRRPRTGDAASHRLELVGYGRRVAALLDGALVAESRDAPPGASGPVLLFAGGPPRSRVVLEALELLGPPE